MRWYGGAVQYMVSNLLWYSRQYTDKASKLFRSFKAVIFTLALANQFWFTIVTEATKDNQFTLRDENGTNQTNNSSGNEVLSAEAIANIAATGAAIAIIGSLTCYLCYCYNHREKMARVRTAIERNRLIRERLAAEKAAAAQSNTNTETFTLT